MFDLLEQRIEKLRVSDPLTQRPAPAVATWPNLAGHWLQSPLAAELELEAHTRRQAAVARWRGLREAAVRR